MKIAHDTKLLPGVYFLPNGIHIDADDITLDGNGALIIGQNFKGRGVSCNQHVGVTIKNLSVERFYHGIWVNAGANIRVQNNTITRTHEIEGVDTFLDVWLDRAHAYGGGIFLSGVQDSFVQSNSVQHQQNGLLLYGCDQVEITGNNASFNSGYGILLYETTHCTVDNNIADYCIRMYHANADGSRYHNGGDAAALVMMCSSSHNVVTHNKLRGSGDGVFLGGFHKDNLKVPCNDNLFENNDGSWSPNIAFEATFSQRNVFRNNKADNCNYGFWLGYSSETKVEGNSIKGNRVAGVAIEHGHHNAITGNTFERNREGVQLWVSLESHFAEWFPDCVESHETTISKNQFSRHDVAVHGWTARKDGPSLAKCHHFSVIDNDLIDNRIGVTFERVRESTITQNRVFDNVEAGIKLVGVRDVATDGNSLERTST